MSLHQSNVWCIPKALLVRGEREGGKKQKGRSEELVFTALRLYTWNLPFSC